MAEGSEAAEAVDTQPKPKATDRLDQLEAMITGLASTVENLSSKMAGPQGIPRTFGPEKLLEGTVDDVRRRIIDLKYPGRETEGFQPDEIVMVREDSSKAKAMRNGLKLDNDEPLPLGTIISYMYVTKREGEAKYKVYFKGYGKDGCLESELERVEL